MSDICSWHKKLAKRLQKTAIKMLNRLKKNNLIFFKKVEQLILKDRFNIREI